MHSLVRYEAGEAQGEEGVLVEDERGERREERGERREERGERREERRSKRRTSVLL